MQLNLNRSKMIVVLLCEKQSLSRIISFFWGTLKDVNPQRLISSWHFIRSERCSAAAPRWLNFVSTLCVLDFCHWAKILVEHLFVCLVSEKALMLRPEWRLSNVTGLSVHQQHKYTLDCHIVKLENSHILRKMCVFLAYNVFGIILTHVETHNDCISVRSWLCSAMICESCSALILKRWTRHSLCSSQGVLYGSW